MTKHSNAFILQVKVKAKSLSQSRRIPFQVPLHTKSNWISHTPVSQTMATNTNDSKVTYEELAELEEDFDAIEIDIRE